jgi:hypothetical protein
MLGRNFTALMDTLPGVANIPSSDAVYTTSIVEGALLDASFGCV